MINTETIRDWVREFMTADAHREHFRRRSCPACGGPMEVLSRNGQQCKVCNRFHVRQYDKNGVVYTVRAA